MSMTIVYQNNLFLLLCYLDDDKIDNDYFFYYVSFKKPIDLFIVELNIVIGILA